MQKNNIFINCPFDKDYISNLLKPILFTIAFFDYNPQIASMKSDSLHQRLLKIIGMIKRSKYSIHDLSRIIAKKKGEPYRLNMAFELGIVIGAKYLGNIFNKNKIGLIISEKRHDYIKALSDMSGVDIKYHNNEPYQTVSIIRGWLDQFSSNESHLPGPDLIWNRYADFKADFYQKRKNDGFRENDIENMEICEYIKYMKEWIKKNR